MTVLKSNKFPFAFNSDACNSCKGYCCRGESGHIWINREELEKIASFLQINLIDFINEYLIKIENRWSLKEKNINDEHTCNFFDEGCTIYKVRPEQCRTYPFWDYYKDKVEEIKKECPGIVEIEQSE